MNDQYESQRQLFHHYTGHYLMAIEEVLETEGTAGVEERRHKVVTQLTAMGSFDLATRCLPIITGADVSTIEGLTAFRKQYDEFVLANDPKVAEMEKVLAKLRASNPQRKSNQQF